MEETEQKPKQNIPVAILILILTLGLFAVLFRYIDDPLAFESTASFANDCNVGVVSIEGDILTISEEGYITSFDIIKAIEEVSKSPDLYGIMLSMDTFGGAAAAAEEVAFAIEASEMPIATYIRGAGLSAGYWIASASEFITALPTSLVGSVGVTYSYLQETNLNQIEGYEFIEITSGEYKEVGNVNKELVPEHKEYLQEITDQMFEVFKDTVVENRNLDRKTVDIVSDGKFFLAERAKELGLIDSVGGIEDIRNYFASKQSVDVNDIVFCDPYLYFDTNGF